MKTQRDIGSGGIVFLLLLIAGILLYNFAGGGLPRIFAVTLIALGGLLLIARIFRVLSR